MLVMAFFGLGRGCVFERRPERVPVGRRACWSCVCVVGVAGSRDQVQLQAVAVAHGAVKSGSYY